MTDLPPIRIERTGFRRWWPATRGEMKKAAVWSESEARKFIWVSPEALCRFMCWQMGEQLATRVEAGIEAWHGDHDMPLIVFDVGKISHYVAVRDCRIEPPLDLTSRVTGTIARSMGRGEPAPAEVKRAVADLAAKVGAAQQPVAAAQKSPPAAPKKK